MSSLKVLQMHNHHATLGGAVEVMQAEASLLRSAGHQIQQLTVPAAQDQDLGSLRAGTRAVWNVPVTRELTSVIERFAPDVVHVHTPFPLMSPAVFRTASRKGVPTVTTVHSYRYSCIAATCLREGAACQDCVGKVIKWPGVQHRCYHGSVGASSALTASLAVHRIMRTFDRHVDRFITLTEFSRELLVRDGFRDEQIVVKPNSVPDPGESIAHTEGRRPFVLFVGRLVAEKGVQTLLDAWPHVAPDVDLHIAGDGQLMPLVRSAAATDPRLQPLGWLSEAETAEQMRRAAIVVVPSEWYEAGPPLVLLRAQALAAPLVVTDVENLSREMLLDEAGITFRVGNPRDLARSVMQLLKDPRRRERLGRNGRQAYLRRYTPQRSLAMLEQIYRSVGAETTG